MLFTNQISIDHLFLNNPYPERFNDPLWTLPYEVSCYFSIALLGILGILSKNKKLIGLIFICIFILFNLYALNPILKVFPFTLDFNLLKLFMFFYAGVIFCLFGNHLKMKLFVFLILLVLLLFSTVFGFYFLIAPLAIPYIIFYLAIKLPTHNFDRYGDFSYGLYIYSFPIQQALSYFQINKYGMFIFFFLTLMIGTLIALVSWHLIENPSLKLKNIPFTRIIFLKIYLEKRFNFIIKKKIN